jgi:hypothetical protein
MKIGIGFDVDCFVLTLLNYQDSPDTPDQPAILNGLSRPNAMAALGLLGHV